MVKNYLKRLIYCNFGLFLFGIATVFCVRAGDAGTNAWNTLSLGISARTGMSFGTATFVTSLLIMLIAFTGKGKLGMGSLCNVVLVPVFSDLCLALFTFIPEAPNMVVGVIFMMIGQVITSVAAVIYMRPALGCGPRDTLMVLLGKKFPKVPIGVIRLGVECSALVAGVLLGAPFGIGTVLVMVLQASIFQAVCKLMKCEPRNVPHESIKESLANMKQKA